MHQSFTYALVKWLFDNFPMFADSFSVVSNSLRCLRLRCELSRTSVPHRAVVPCDHGLLVLVCITTWIVLVCRTLEIFDRKPRKSNEYACEWMTRIISLIQSFAKTIIRVLLSDSWSVYMRRWSSPFPRSWANNMSGSSSIVGLCWTIWTSPIT